MKRNMKCAISKLLMSLTLVTVQVNTWAAETNNSGKDPWDFFMQPWPWILVIVTAIITLAGPFDYKKDYTVVMKKKTGGKKSS